MKNTAVMPSHVAQSAMQTRKSSRVEKKITKRWAVWQCGVLLKIRQNESRGAGLNADARDRIIEGYRLQHETRINTALRHGIKWDTILKFDLDYPWISDTQFREEINAFK